MLEDANLEAAVPPQGAFDDRTGWTLHPNQMRMGGMSFGIKHQFKLYANRGRGDIDV